MRKPLLSDFGLTEQILERHKANEKEVADREEHYLRWAKATRGKILIISLVVTFVVFILAGVLEFTPNKSLSVFTIALVADFSKTAVSALAKLAISFACLAPLHAIITSSFQ